jgi:hypothetical protein
MTSICSWHDNMGREILLPSHMDDLTTNTFRLETHCNFRKLGDVILHTGCPRNMSDYTSGNCDSGDHICNWLEILLTLPLRLAKRTQTTPFGNFNNADVISTTVSSTFFHLPACTFDVSL